MRGVIQYIKQRLKNNNKSANASASLDLSGPVVIPRSSHCISRKQISANCRKVLYRLSKAGYEAYLVGGSVRDLLLGHEPKDFDVATSATPEEVRKLFRNCRLIGKRFRLAHVYFRHEVIEVATFRANVPCKQSMSQDGLVIRDNVYGSIEEDVIRRDFTINALLYDINRFTVIDYTEGLEDLDHGLIRLIGDPVTRYREDPVRILRAVRFAAKLGFHLEEATAAPIRECAILLEQIPAARLFEEFNKLFFAGYAAVTFSLLLQYNLFGLLFPATQACLGDTTLHLPVDTFLQTVFQSTDDRVDDGKPVSVVFLLAAILWHPYLQQQYHFQAGGFRSMVAKDKACDAVLSQETHTLAIPRKMHHHIRDIWNSQSFLEERRGKRPLRMVRHPRFRAGYDFLLLRAEADPNLKETAQWWKTFYHAKHEQRIQMITDFQKHKRRKSKN